MGDRGLSVAQDLHLRRENAVPDVARLAAQSRSGRLA
jgi:hypothetical protein